jgi:hypothetical protein
MKYFYLFYYAIILFENLINITTFFFSELNYKYI